MALELKRGYFLEHEGEGKLVSSSLTRERGYMFRCDEWITKLTVPDGETVVKSPIYTLEVPFVTKWQIELKPNFVDKQGTRHLSFWVRLVESEKEKVVASWAATIVTSTCDDDDDDYVKEAIRLTYTKEDPCQGFPKYIEMYRIQSNDNPLITFGLQLQIYDSLVTINVGPNTDENPETKIVASKPLETKTDVSKPLETKTVMSKPLVNLDGTLMWYGIEFFVDSKRLSEYSFVFKRRFRTRSINNTVDVSNIFETKYMLDYIIRFCHYDGESMPFPKRPQGVKKLAQMSVRLGMPSLMDACHKRVVAGLQPKYFSEIVDLVQDDILDAFVIMPWLMQFLYAHYEEVIQDDVLYAEKYKDNKKLFKRYYLKKPTWDDDVDVTDSDSSDGSEEKKPGMYEGLNIQERLAVAMSLSGRQQ